MRCRVSFLIVLSLLLLPAGCAAGAAGNQAGLSQSAERRSDGLRLTLKTKKTRYKPGQAVAMRLAAFNDSDKAIDLRFSSSKTHDFVVRDQRGREVWRWSRGRAFAQAITERRLRPDGRVVMSAMWDQKTDRGKRVRPGVYELEGTLLTVGRARSVGPVVIMVTD